MVDEQPENSAEEAQEEDFLEKLQRKSAKWPLVQACTTQLMKEINERYVPLYELKMQSKVEGIDFGLEQATALNKREHMAEQARLRIV